MTRHMSRLKARPGRKGRQPVCPDQEPITTVLTADEIELNARLHEQAAQSVTTTLTRMQERTQLAAQANPELAPFLTAYFEAAGTSLLQNTLALLDEPPVVSPPQRHQPHVRRWWRSPLRRLIPICMRKEQLDGTA